MAMLNTQHSPRRPAYGPTSLDFINKPNPVEPHAVAHRGSLDSTKKLEKSTNEDLLRVLLDGTNPAPQQSPAKRRKTEDNSLLDLPKLPVRPGNNVKRLRIPPTLSGLYQPPPDAKLLPSISIEHPTTGVESAVIATPSRVREPTASSPDQQVPEGSYTMAPSSKKGRKKWSDEETACLMRGVAKFGIGNWSKILKDPDSTFNHRTALDLKDRFRIIGPAEYRRKRPSSNPTESASTPSHQQPPSTAKAAEQPTFETPLPKVNRRKRHPYTPVEDEALLRGFVKHGKSWAAIQQDADLHLDHRTSTDLRDRLRTRYPETYAEAGLAPRPADFPKPAMRVPPTKSSPTSSIKPNTSSNEQQIPQPARTTSTSNPPSHAQSKLPFTLPSAAFSDVFFGSPYSGSEDEASIVLDRGILDFAQLAKPTAEAASSQGIDPLVTLKLPRLIPPSTTLPALNANAEAEEGTQQIPSFMHYFGTLETEGRSGGGGLTSGEELVG